MISKTQWQILNLMRKLWVRAALIGLLGVAAAATMEASACGCSASCRSESGEGAFGASEGDSIFDSTTREQRDGNAL